jgi:predicted ATPase
LRSGEVASGNAGDKLSHNSGVAAPLRAIHAVPNGVTAERYNDSSLLVFGHYAAVNSYFWLGDLIKAREHGDRVLELYSDEQHGRLVDILNHDPKTVSLVFTARAIWMLGYPEQAVKLSETRDAHARRLGHPFDLGFALAVGALLFNYLGKPDEALKRAEEARRLGHENSMPYMTEQLVPGTCGIALIRKGRFEEGVASLKACLAVSEQAGGKAGHPSWMSIVAEATAELGDIDHALAMIEEIITELEEPACAERCYYAEILRLKGWMLEQKRELQEAERTYLASLDWAREQLARSWELRTATSYARLMRKQGRISEAYELLAPVYNWFTEGFETKDLKEAKALLNQLGAAAKPQRLGDASRIAGTR